LASEALAATGLLSAKAVADQEPAKKANNTVITNPSLDAANPDSSNPPATDAGGLPFKYPASLGEKFCSSR
jgi:hypothetical protein